MPRNMRSIVMLPPFIFTTDDSTPYGNKKRRWVHPIALKTQLVDVVYFSASPPAENVMDPIPAKVVACLTVNSTGLA